jgi:uncharacterized protein (DUF2336 family)
MSSSTPMSSPPPAMPDYTLPIARTGEQQFAAIIRQRSGFDAGIIDMAVRDITHLSILDQQDAVEAAYAIYETLRNQTGKVARRDEMGVRKLRPS